jgi:hypothetical protein
MRGWTDYEVDWIYHKSNQIEDQFINYESFDKKNYEQKKSLIPCIKPTQLNQW